MDRLVYKYEFAKYVPINDIEDTLMVAALAAEALHGRAAMKLDASFRLNKKARVCVIDAETPVGCDIARIFTTFIVKGYGEPALSVERTEERANNRGLLSVIGVAL